MARDCENEREEPSNGERKRAEPKKSVSDSVIVRESGRDRKRPW